MDHPNHDAHHAGVPAKPDTITQRDFPLLQWLQDVLPSDEAQDCLMVIESLVNLGVQDAEVIKEICTHYSDMWVDISDMEMAHPEGLDRPLDLRVLFMVGASAYSDSDQWMDVAESVRDLGLDSAYFISRWIEEDVTPDSAARFVTVAARHPDVDLARMDFTQDPELYELFSGSSIPISGSLLHEYQEAGASKFEAARLAHAGITPEVLRGYREAGITATQEVMDLAGLRITHLVAQAAQAQNIPREDWEEDLAHMTASWANSEAVLELYSLDDLLTLQRHGWGKVGAYELVQALTTRVPLSQPRPSTRGVPLAVYFAQNDVPLSAVHGFAEALTAGNHGRTPFPPLMREPVDPDDLIRQIIALRQSGVAPLKLVAYRAGGCRTCQEVRECIEAGITPAIIRELLNDHGRVPEGESPSSGRLAFGNQAELMDLFEQREARRYEDAATCGGGR